MTLPTFQLLPHDQIREPEDPSRLAIDSESLNTLADDIAVNGLLQPIGVRGPMPDGRFDLAYGHRRWLAVGMLGWPSIDAKVFARNVDLHQIRASENHQREPLTPIEEAREIAAFLARNEPVASVARRYRKSQAWVHQRLALLHYPPDIQDAVHAGQLKLGVAAALAQIEHEGYRKDVVAEAIRNGVTTPTAELWLQHWRTEGARLAANHAVVEEIALRRADFILKVPCDLCRDEVEFSQSRGYRCCPACADALDAEVARSQREGQLPVA